MNICYIVGAADCDVNFTRDNSDFVIACDGGLRHLDCAGIVPDLIVGDFDSLGRLPDAGNFIIHPCEKDDTDTILAVREGQKRGFRSFHIYGGLGGRIDHSLANIQTLSLIASFGGKGYLIDSNSVITVVKNGFICFPDCCKGYISVFAVGGIAQGVNITGLHYQLKNSTLLPDYPIGVSNEFAGTRATISVENGLLGIVWFDKHMPE